MEGKCGGLPAVPTLPRAPSSPLPAFRIDGAVVRPCTELPCCHSVLGQMYRDTDPVSQCPTEAPRCPRPPCAACNPSLPAARASPRPVCCVGERLPGSRAPGCCAGLGASARWRGPASDVQVIPPRLLTSAQLLHSAPLLLSVPRVSSVVHMRCAEHSCHKHPHVGFCAAPFGQVPRCTVSGSCGRSLFPFGGASTPSSTLAAPLHVPSTE